MRKYEIMYIVKGALEEAVRTDLVTSLNAILTNNGAVITKADDWGLREFAYPIDFATRGYYMVLNVEANPEAVQEFDRLTRINPNVVRTLIINLDEE
jgi:small subunit ribosomal protein S6